jgi:thiamine pyrophosphate-dependent acetolactate synthase large subunit-like protein
MAETVSDALLARLIDWGVDTIFGIPGDGINGIHGSAPKAPRGRALRAHPA